MKDIHDIFTTFKHDFPDIYARHEALGHEIHQASGPLPEQVRWLIKVAVSAASRHSISLETHIAKAREAGCSEEDITQSLLLVLPTTGFPTFMEAYTVYKNMG
jgi:alkylhydroperoxidase/carboxymuconolactone decarboxylase family protein YurZ